MRVQNRQEYDEAVGVVAWLRQKAHEAGARASLGGALASLEATNSIALRVAASRIVEEFLLPDATDVQSNSTSAEVPAKVHESGWQWRPTGDNAAFAPPFGTIRVCRMCGCLVAGGPTACVRCADEAKGP